jgi:hypothetical protein
MFEALEIALGGLAVFALPIALLFLGYGAGL